MDGSAILSFVVFDFGCGFALILFLGWLEKGDGILKRRRGGALV